MAIGVSYFGNRILRHVAADMEDLAERGFTGVLHTFSENDFNYYRAQMTRIVEMSHDVGLEVQVSPWGVAHVFGGEAESLLLAQRPDLGQVFNGSGLVGAGCLNRTELREFVHRWTDAAVELGADRIFFDEPQWARPVKFGRPAESWACACDACRDAYQRRYGRPMPSERTPELTAFHQEVLVDFIRDIVAHVAARGARCTVNLFPHLAWLPGGDVWEAVGALSGLDTLATDPAWVAFDQELEEFVGGHARRLVDLTIGNSITPQLWIQGFDVGPEHVDEIHAAVRLAREAGVQDLWTWGYEACAHMTGLGTREPAVVWEALTDALTGRTG